ncbi:dihydrofolate reductase family protein [Roseivirga sp. E12]|uniref:dihydrofolate reductase family protein n=1 Tax=Roseivirga sp. E12 TaxID=2819237 RepID=UPI001ABD30F4|nr:dihydrofolate reductase family protein [Roseivirga sp. E12]MBO3697598.1 dihydrofolate reductase [Roseivirga sp. E12]
MEKKNSVYIGTSLDGYIADSDGKIDFLDTFTFPEGEDMGYYAFMDRIDALVMGRVTFETVLGFNVPWPYQKPVYVLSNTLEQLPADYEDKAHLIKGPLKEVLANIHKQGHSRLYIDGGSTIQSFLKEDLIDEMIITTIPVLVGGGHPLFGEVNQTLIFECANTQRFADKVVQNRFLRIK